MVDGSKLGLLHHYTQQSFAQQGREKSLQNGYAWDKIDVHIYSPKFG